MKRAGSGPCASSARGRRRSQRRRAPATGPSACQGRSRKATGVDGSCSNPSQPSRARRCTREMSCHAARAWRSTNGLVRANAAAASSARDERASATSPSPRRPPELRARTPGYFADAASPTARPAQARRPSTASARATVITSVEQDVGDRNPRVRDVRRRNGDGGCAHDRRARPIGPAAEPPRRRNASDSDQDRRPTRRLVGRRAKDGLNRSEQRHQQRRVVVPAGIEMPPWPIRHARGTMLPSSGFEHRIWKAVANADDPERGASSRIAAKAIARARPREARHPRAARCRGR